MGRPALPVAIGQRFSRLVVTELRFKYGDKHHRVLCQCDCGRTSIVQVSYLYDGRVKSCGCYKDENTKRRETTHGHTAREVRDATGLKETPEYRCWRHFRERCYSKKDPKYSDYGGRGICVCDEWRVSFEAFIAHVGLRPSRIHSIDRINNDGHYEPGNVRWATRSEQQKNRRKRRSHAAAPC